AKAGCIAYKLAAHAGDVARGIARARDWDDDLSRARAALNWPRQFELAFDGETARALHDEDLEVDTDFCAMCGHDWCSMRISKEIQAFLSGKDAGFQPARRAQRSPGVSEEGRELLRQRGGALPVIDGKHACHSDHVPDAERARAVQAALAKPGAQTPRLRAPVDEPAGDGAAGGVRRLGPGAVVLRRAVAVVEDGQRETGHGAARERGVEVGRVEAVPALHDVPAEVDAARDRRGHEVDLLEEVLANVGDVEVAGGAVEAVAPRVAQPLGEVRRR